MYVYLYTVERHFSPLTNPLDQSPEASWVGGHGARAPPQRRKFRKFSKISKLYSISTALVHDDVMGFECKCSLEKYQIVPPPPIESLLTTTMK